MTKSTEKSSRSACSAKKHKKSKKSLKKEVQRLQQEEQRLRSMLLSKTPVNIYVSGDYYNFAGSYFGGAAAAELPPLPPPPRRFVGVESESLPGGPTQVTRARTGASKDDSDEEDAKLPARSTSPAPTTPTRPSSGSSSNGGSSLNGGGSSNGGSSLLATTLDDNEGTNTSNDDEGQEDYPDILSLLAILPPRDNAGSQGAGKTPERRQRPRYF